MEWMRTVMRDLYQSVSRLRKERWLSLLVILTLGLAIGAHATIFSLIDVLFIRPLPVEEPEELVGVYETRDGTGFYPLSFADYLDYRSASSVFEGLAAHYGSAPLMLQIGDEPQDEINGAVVSANYFPLLGVEPARGRFFLPEEDAVPGAHPVAVISYDLWQSRLGGQEDVVGAVVKLNATAFTVIGVAPERFEGVRIDLPSEVWIPTMMSAVGYRWCDTFSRDCTWMEMIGRLAPGRTLERARAEMEALSRRVRQAHPSGDDTELGLAVELLTGLDPEVRPQRLRLATLLLVAVTLVLVVAGANVSGLLIVRSLARTKEIAVRSALGAPRWRVVLPFLTDTALLALAGSGVGLLVATWLTGLLGRLYPGAVPLELGIDLKVAGYALLLAVVVGLLSGFVPGVQAARPNLVTVLKDTVTTGRRGRPKLLGSLVVLQIALSFVLLTGTGLMVRSLSEVREVGTFDSGRVATLRLRPRQIGYGPERAQPFTREVVQRLSRLPGVESATLVAGLPPPFWYDGPYTVSPSGQPEAVAHPDRGLDIWINEVAPGFFETFSLSLLRGRDFDERDAAEAPLVTVVNRKLATTLWPDGEAVGERLVLGGDLYQVIGVAQDPPVYLTEDTLPQAYLAYFQNPGNVDARIAVRTASEATSQLALLREEIRAVNPDVPVVEVDTMRGRLRRAFGQTFLAGRVLGLAGALTLFLSAVGLFGVLALAVAQRTHEIGIRQAVGGTRADIVALVVRDSMILVGLALVLGLAAALAVGRALAHFLYGVSPYDPVTLISVLGVLAVAGALASWWPARRAARVDPLVALREL